MTIPKKSIPSLAALLALLLPAAGSPFELRPMTQTFEPAGSGVSGTFEVHNDLDEEVAVTVTLKARAINAEGVETLTDTKDFSVFPTETMLKGKSFQVIRVRWQGKPALPSERPYRIIAEEVQLKSSKAQPSGPSKGGIKLILRYGGTIYVAPPKAQADIVVAAAKKIDKPEGSMLELDLENRGSRHAIIDRPSLSLKVGEATSRISEPELDKALGGMNILAGSKRRILLPWPAGLPLGSVKAKLDASYLR